MVADTPQEDIPPLEEANMQEVEEPDEEDTDKGDHKTMMIKGDDLGLREYERLVTVVRPVRLSALVYTHVWLAL